MLGDGPRQVYHGYDGLEILQFVPLVALGGEVVLLGSERADVPRNVIAPTGGLDPMDCASINPHQIAGTLNETVNWHVGVAQIRHTRPPGTVEVVHIVPTVKRQL